MAYFTGTANNPSDLLGKLRTHAETLGWVTDRASASEWLCHNADGYWSFNAGSNQWQLAGNTGFDNGLAWNAQPGSSVQNNPYSSKEATIAQLSAGPFTRYHLFATAAYLHLHVEIAAGQFRPVMIGSLNKRGVAYTGGQYVCGSFIYSPGQALTNNWSSHPFDGYHIRYSGGGSVLRLDSLDGSPSPDWLPFDYTTNVSRRVVGPGRGNYSSQYHPDVGLIDASANELNSSTNVVPCAIYAFGAQQRSRYIGEAPDFGLCRMDFLAPGDSITIGTDTWRVFPLLQRGTASDFGNTSALVGYAFRVVRVEMATFPGFQVPRPVEAVVAWHHLPNISALFLTQDITLGSPAPPIWAGSYAAHQPVDVIHSAYSAFTSPTWPRDFYNRIC